MNIVNVARERKINQNASIERLNRANFPKSEIYFGKSVGKPRFDPLGIEPARQEVCQPTPSNSVPTAHNFERFRNRANLARRLKIL